MDNQERGGNGLCILSFDGGGPGSLSQLRMLDELMLRLAYKPGIRVDELHPSDYFDLMGGVGFGGLVALLLGRLRMTTSQAMEEVAAIGTETFLNDDGIVSREVNMARLRQAILSMLERHGHPMDIPVYDSSNERCKVVIFAATAKVMDHCHPFRTYLAPRKCLDCTFVDAACATMAIPEYFSPVNIGPRLRAQRFAGIPHGFDNPIREVLKESQLVFGEARAVSLVLSLGSGRRAPLSDLDQHATRLTHIHSDGVARDLQHQLRGVGAYLRLNVDNGLETAVLDDWSELGSIEAYTNVYLEILLITKYIDQACQWLRNRNGSVTLGQLIGTNSGCEIRLHSETLKDYLKMEFQQMHNIVQQLGIERITLVDAIGNDIPIPRVFCLTYSMLLELISLYFRHQRAPGSDFVERGDYRLVHGDRKNIIGQIEWKRVKKVGLKVEMSMILRTRNRRAQRCPSCSASFDGKSTDAWVRCLCCSTEFQIENQVQVGPALKLEDTDQPSVESEGMLGVEESDSGHQPLMIERPSNGETFRTQFRLLSVINITAVPLYPSPANLATQHLALESDDGADKMHAEMVKKRTTKLLGGYCSKSPADTEGSADSAPDEDDLNASNPTSLTASTKSTPILVSARWVRFIVPDDVFLNPADPVRHEFYHKIRFEPWFVNQTQERPITSDEASRIPGALPGESVLLAFYDRVPDAKSNRTEMRCTICMQTNQDSPSYNRPDRARVHMRHHFELRPIPCTGRCNVLHCRKRFFTAGDLNAHIVGKTEHPVPCQYCAKALRPKNLQSHLAHFCQRTPLRYARNMDSD